MKIDKSLLSPSQLVSNHISLHKISLDAWIVSRLEYISAVKPHI